MQTPYVPHVYGSEVHTFLRSRTGWFTAAVASSIPWPLEDVWVRYAGDDFVLRGTENGEEGSAPAITTPSSRDEYLDSLAKVLRFCSVLGWFRGGYVDVVNYFHANHPHGFGVHVRTAFSTVMEGRPNGFDCNYMPVLAEDKVRVALAFWREGQRLTGVHNSYAFLSYFKVIESQFDQGKAGSAKRVAWIEKNLDLLDGKAAHRVAALRADGEDVNRHLFDSGRNAVAHATLDGGIVDPDVPVDRQRIAEDLVLMRDLAHRMIATDLCVPTDRDVFASRDRLAPWDALIDVAALRALRQGQTPALQDIGLSGRQMSVALRSTGLMPGLQNMTIHVEAVRDGVVQIAAINERQTMALRFVLDYREGKAHTQIGNDGMLLRPGGAVPDEADARAYYTYFYRVLGNEQADLRIEGHDPVECDEVYPINIMLPTDKEAAINEAVAQLLEQLATRCGG